MPGAVHGDLMFLKVCCGLKYSASFTSSFEQDDGITVLLQTPDLDNFFLVCIPMDVASITFSNPILFRATARVSSANSPNKVLSVYKYAPITHAPIAPAPLKLGCSGSTKAVKPSFIPFTPQSSLLSPTISPISPSFSGTNERERELA